MLFFKWLFFFSKKRKKNKKMVLTNTNMKDIHLLTSADNVLVVIEESE